MRNATLELHKKQPESADPLTSCGIQPSPYLRKKQIFVRILAVLLSVPLLPIVLILMAAVRLTSPGPGLYLQKRLGLGGKPFTIFKLRSMRQDAEALTGPMWAKVNDPRVTPLGKFLRDTHLDEFPQIINVLLGHMDFVGPRPERPELTEDLANKVENFNDRLLAKPGITGLAQVNLPPDQTVDCVRLKLAADRYYIENASLWLDVRLLMATVLRLLGIRYHHGAKLLRVTLPESVLRVAKPAPVEPVRTPAESGLESEPDWKMSRILIEEETEEDSEPVEPVTVGIGSSSWRRPR